MKQLILLWTIIILGTLGASGQDKIEWSEKRKLTVNDFKGRPPDPSKKQSLIVNFGLETNLKKSDIGNLKTFNRQVTNLFSPANSWIDWTEQSRLRYAITLFDLNEWKARELRKRLNENRKLVLAGQFQEIEETVRREFDKIQQDYESESEFGDNPIGQMNWETRINEQLLGLADFCKNCEQNKN